MNDSRILVDASTIIALAKIGELDFLRDFFAEVYITPSVQEEVLVEDYPETGQIEKSIGKWIKVIEIDEADLERNKEFGLGEGEASIIEIAREEDGLVLDDPVARNVAKVQGLDYTGLIGLVVEASDAGVISKEEAKDILEKLSESDFRMTTELYNWALKKLDG